MDEIMGIGDRSDWDRFARLGEAIGDGDLSASESKWMNREYKKLSRALIPEIDEKYKVQRKLKAHRINEQMTELLKIKKCACGGTLQQARSGSKICYCIVCNSRYAATKKRKIEK